MKAIYLSLALLVSGGVTASEDVDFKLVGEGKMTYMFWDVYNAKLHTKSGKYEPDAHPVKLSLTYLRDIEASDIVDATFEQWRHLDKDQHIEQYGDLLTGLWPDVSEGDELSFSTNEQGHGTFAFNGEALKTVEDAEFSQAFLSIWLSENTSRPKLRNKLIGSENE